MTNELSYRSSKPVAIWLLIGVGMIIIQIILGGITRLTGSGLSITEWNVVTGTLPPLNDHQWIAEFEKYKQTPQYNLLNFDFNLKDFKFIFFWEWFHRFWARLIGVVFAVPFLLFLFQKKFKPEMVKPMIILFLLGALQGVIGWIMVASGLTGDAIYVKPTRLALHFIFALGLLSYTFWFALELIIPKEKLVNKHSIKIVTWISLILLTIQLMYGALMAGHKAATSAPTWPDINGYIIPPNMMGNSEGWLNLLDNKITIQFMHRGLAYILVALIAILTIHLYKNKILTPFKKNWGWPILFILLQTSLGIFTVLSSLKIQPGHWGLYEWMAQLHQLVAILLLLSLTWVLFIVQGKKVFT